VSNAEPAFQRARRPEHKQQRYEAILAAARKLGLRDGVRAVSLTDIAAEVGMHKSAVLRYFGTREEIYLHLTAQGWRDWAQAARAEIGDEAPVSADRLAAALARTLAERPLFCELLAHASLNLERHVSAEAVHAFKLTAVAVADDLGSLAARVVPDMSQADGRDLIAAVTALAASLWQYSHPPEVLAGLYATDPRLAHAAVDFTPRLERLTRAVILGLADAPSQRLGAACLGSGFLHVAAYAYVHPRPDPLNKDLISAPPLNMVESLNS
jgi:AcrR family transcriptional regulator